MAGLTVVNLGNNTSTPLGVPTEMDNAIEVYSGLVLTAFERKVVFLPLVMNKTIEAGSSMSFPVIGQSSDGDTNTHIPGTELTMSDIKVKDRIINIDALEYYSLNVDHFEEKILHFETRNELAKQSGEALAVKIDKAVGSEVLTASQTSGTIGGDVLQADGGEVNNDLIHTGTTSKAKGDALIEATFTAVAQMEEKDVYGDKVLVVKPITYAYLAQSDAVNKDITSGSNGGLDTGMVMDVAGIGIVKSNNVPTVAVGQTSVGVNVGETNTRYVQGLLFNEECVGVVKLLDITSEQNYLPKQLSTLLTSYYSYGMGVLKPGASTVITGGDTGVLAV